MLAIADLAGGGWPERARAAALALSAGTDHEDESEGVRLLADIQAIYAERRAERLPSAELVSALLAIEEAPWGDLRGKEIDTRKLAAQLKVFGVKPDKWRAGQKTVRGYLVADFGDVWPRYLSAVGAPQAPQAPQETDSDSARVADVAIVAAITGCAHRPAGEADGLWELGPSTWGADAAACSCCGGPAREDLLELGEDGCCPTCRNGAPALEKGGHLVRHALDVGLELVAG